MSFNRATRLLIFKFICVGTLAFFVNYAALEAFLLGLDTSKPVAAILAMIVTINMTFLMHNKWTYVKPKEGYYMSSSRRYFSYLSTNSTGALITIVGFSVLSTQLPNIVSLGISALLAMIWNFIMNLIVWRHGRKISADINPILS